MKYFAAIAFGSLLLVACSDNSTGQGNSSSSGKKAMERRKMVIFFTPSSTELAQLEEKGEDLSGLMALLDEFEMNASEFIDSTGIPGLQARITDNPVITLIMDNGETFSFQRDNNENQYGGILFDGRQPPKIIHGIYRDFEIREVAKGYFGNAQ